MIAKFHSKLTIVDWKMLEHVIRYLIGTKTYGSLPSGRNGEVHIFLWTNADWARDPSNLRSRNGVLVTLKNGPVISKSKLQTSTAPPTLEA